MYPVAGLPGWTREVVTRSKGAWAGSVDIYYHPATDRKCRSKKEMQEVLGAGVDLSKLVFKTVVFTNNLETDKYKEFVSFLNNNVVQIRFSKSQSCQKPEHATSTPKKTDDAKK